MKTKSLFEKIQEISLKVDFSKNRKGFNYKYEDFSQLSGAIKEHLQELKLCVSQVFNGSELITLVIDLESGERHSSSLNIPFIELLKLEPLENKKGELILLNPIQKIGSYITYLKRQELKTIFFLAEEDLDGNNEFKDEKKSAVKNEKLKAGDKINESDYKEIQGLFNEDIATIDNYLSNYLNSEFITISSLEDKEYFKFYDHLVEQKEKGLNPFTGEIFIPDLEVAPDKNTQSLEDQLLHEIEVAWCNEKHITDNFYKKHDGKSVDELIELVKDYSKNPEKIKELL